MAFIWFIIFSTWSQTRLPLSSQISSKGFLNNFYHVIESYDDDDVDDDDDNDDYSYDNEFRFNDVLIHEGHLRQDVI